MTNLISIINFNVFTITFITTCVNILLFGSIVFSLMLLMTRTGKLSPKWAHNLLFASILGVFVYLAAGVLVPRSVNLLDLTALQTDASAPVTNHALLERFRTGLFSIPPDPNQILFDAGENHVRYNLHWTFWAFLVWVVVSAGFFFKHVAGIISTNMNGRQLKRITGPKVHSLVSMFRNQYNIRRPVSVKQDETGIPYTFNVFRPVIVLPRASKNWNNEKLNTVLIHEMNHIKRYDVLTLQITRVVCSLLWFLPFIWLVYKKQREEQEKACDSSVIQNGIHPADYAQQLLDFARMPELSHSRYVTQMSSKSFFEQRLVCILETTQLNFKCSTFLLVISFLVLGLLLAFSSNITMLGPANPEAMIIQKIQEMNKATQLNLSIDDIPKGMLEKVEHIPLVWPIADGEGLLVFDDIDNPEYRYNVFYATPGAKVVAAAQGTVVRMDNKTSEGKNEIVIKHSNDYYSAYYNIGDFEGIQLDAEVEIGQVIGTVGTVRYIEGQGVLFYKEVKNDRLVKRNEFPFPVEYRPASNIQKNILVKNRF